MQTRTATTAEPLVPAPAGRFRIMKLEERIAPKKASQATQSVNQTGLVNVNANVAVALNLLSPGATATASIF